MSEKKTEITKKTEVSLDKPTSILDFANDLKDLIVQNKLFSNIKGKNYINVEGWQIAGAFLGIYPIVDTVENLSDGTHYKYRAEVNLYDKDGTKVGSGMAICSNKEAGKRGFDEYAVASMAQTRAVGKAFRMKIGWLLKVAGYETTPAEEMSQVIDGDVQDEEVMSSEKIAEKAWLIDHKGFKFKVACCASTEKLVELWNEIPEGLQNDYRQLFKERRASLEDKK